MPTKLYRAALFACPMLLGAAAGALALDVYGAAVQHAGRSPASTGVRRNQ